MNNDKTASDPVSITHDFFYVGGEYVGPPGKEVMGGQMYVEDLGITGNGHMLMLERNSRDIAELLHQWIAGI